MIIVITGGEELRLFQHGYTRKAVTQRRSIYNAAYFRGKGEIVEKKMELTAACYRLAVLIKAGKEPVNYEKLWKDFKKKKK